MSVFHFVLKSCRNGYGTIFNFTDVLRLHFIEITSHGQAFTGHYGNDTSCAEEGVSWTSQ